MGWSLGHPKLLQNWSREPPGVPQDAQGAPRDCLERPRYVPGVPQERPGSAREPSRTSRDARKSVLKRPETTRGDQNRCRVASEIERVVLFLCGSLRKRSRSVFSSISVLFAKTANPLKYRACRSKSLFGPWRRGSSWMQCKTRNFVRNGVVLRPEWSPDLRISSGTQSRNRNFVRTRVPSPWERVRGPEFHPEWRPEGGNSVPEG